MEDMMDASAKYKFRTIGLIGVALLLIAIPSSLGILRLRSSVFPSAAAASSAAIPNNMTIAVSDEVYNSVLSRPTPAPAAAAVYSRLKVLQNDEFVPVPNGGIIPLENDLQAEVFIAPYPPTNFSADVDLYLTTGDGQPVTEAEINIEYDMMYMNHGPSEAKHVNLGNGHYLISYDFFMYGPWIQDTWIKMPGQESWQYLLTSIYVWPED
jgi:hypothetical protein